MQDAFIIFSLPRTCTQVVSSLKGINVHWAPTQCSEHLRIKWSYLEFRPTVYIQVWSLTNVIENDRIIESHNTLWFFPKEIVFLK